MEFQGFLAPAEQLQPFGVVVLFIAGALLLAGGGLVVSWLLRPAAPNEEKLSPYECGEDTVGTTTGPFNVRYYSLAIMFLLFEVELLFLFPWALVYADPGLTAATGGIWPYWALGEMVLFLLLLAFALAFAWAKGYLVWDVAPRAEQRTGSPVPDALYEAFNQAQHNPKAA